MRGLKDKVAIVTGGGQGIGRGIALRLAEEGCKVALFDMNPDAGAETEALAGDAVVKTNKNLNGYTVTLALGKTKLDKLSQNIRIDDIRYPSTKSKQITILCSNTVENYVIELRNSKAGEYPNDTKFKVKK